MESPFFLGKYHQNGGFVIATLVYWSIFCTQKTKKHIFHTKLESAIFHDRGSRLYGHPEQVGQNVHHHGFTNCSSRPGALSSIQLPSSKLKKIHHIWSPIEHPWFSAGFPLEHALQTMTAGNFTSLSRGLDIFATALLAICSLKRIANSSLARESDILIYIYIGGIPGPLTRESEAL